MRRSSMRPWPLSRQHGLRAGPRRPRRRLDPGAQARPVGLDREDVVGTRAMSGLVAMASMQISAPPHPHGAGSRDAQPSRRRYPQRRRRRLWCRRPRAAAPPAADGGSGVHRANPPPPRSGRAVPRDATPVAGPPRGSCAAPSQGHRIDSANPAHVTCHVSSQPWGAACPRLTCAGQGPNRRRSFVRRRRAWPPSACAPVHPRSSSPMWS